MEDIPKGFKIFKKINQPAKIVGLYYNTFFIFVLSSVLIIMVFSSKFKLIGILYGIFLIMLIYLVLFYYQTKFGPKKIGKMVNDFTKPIHFIKMSKSIKKKYKK